MNQSPVLSRLKTADYRGHELDYHADFTQFLEEARNRACSTLTAPHLKTAGEAQLEYTEKNNRKTWKKSLISWIKTDKKGKSTNQPTNKSATGSKPRRRHFSGPVQGIASGRAQKGAEEYEVPYMCLGQLNNPQKLYSYGPVYSVS